MPPLMRVVAVLTCSERNVGFEEMDPLSDPLYRLQYIARLAIQFDLADLTALLLTPLAVLMKH